ncbi:hypothetical protein [Blattabacterium cuenoti]|uniref:hypothetical protein n=1 Tax=Blattabacterium cuenoti TaxID=1653831 RepID=UPI00163C0C23|nr:hypothetical protein [Blattabacterium cuenoti]
MKTFVNFVNSTFFFTLGFILSCNDNVTPVKKEKSEGDNPPDIVGIYSPNLPPNFISSSMVSSNTPNHYQQNSNSEKNLLDIEYEDLSRQIQEKDDKIKILEKESEQYFDEYYSLIDVQKGILNEIIRTKKIMRSKPVGSQEEKDAQKEFEHQKKLGKEKLEIIKDKNIFLNKKIKKIMEIRNEKTDLQMRQEELKKQKEQSN